MPWIEILALFEGPSVREKPSARKGVNVRVDINF